MATETHLATVLARAPASASQREYLRSGLPAIYREAPVGTEPFAMRFVTGLEEVLDPIVAMLDLLPAHLDLDLAPEYIVGLVGGWLGIDLDPELPPDARKRLVRNASELTHKRGTLAGLELLLGLAFENTRFEVSDSGGAEPTLTVVCPAGMRPAAMALVGRLVREVKPAHVGLDMRRAGEEPA